MKIIFFGTPEYVIPIAKILRSKLKLADKHEKQLIAVVTQPPKPVGRKKLLQFSPIDNWAYKHKLQIFKDLDTALPAADLGILAAYGKIIPERVIKHFKHGILNIHPSLLPKYRGASPVQAAITAGETETGASIIKLDTQLDHGPVLTQFKEPISPNQTSQDLYTKLFQRAAETLPTLIPAYFDGKIKPKEQDHTQATFTTIIQKDHSFIPLNYLTSALDGKTLTEEWSIPFIRDFKTTPSPQSIHNLIRASYPWPIAWTKVSIKGQEKRLKLISSEIKEGKLLLNKVQLEGKNPTPWLQFQQSYPEVLS